MEESRYCMQCCDEHQSRIDAEAPPDGCHNCRFMRTDKLTNAPVCRRYPAVQPADDWCGEHKPSKEEEHERITKANRH
jgi:hypothetical protein